MKKNQHNFNLKIADYLLKLGAIDETGPREDWRTVLTYSGSKIQLIHEGRCSHLTEVLTILMTDSRGAKQNFFTFAPVQDATKEFRIHFAASFAPVAFGFSWVDLGQAERIQTRTGYQLLRPAINAAKSVKGKPFLVTQTNSIIYI